MILYRIYEKVGKNPLRIIGTVVAGNAEDAVARAKAGNWDKRLMDDAAETPENLVAFG